MQIMRLSRFSLLIGLLAIMLGGCSKSRFDTSTIEGWKDSISQTTPKLSFMGVALGDSIGCKWYGRLYNINRDIRFPHEKVIERDDVLSVKYATVGSILVEGNVHRTSYIFDGKVFQIVIETDNFYVFNMIMDAYKKKFNCHHELSDDEIRRIDLVFKNAEMTTSVEDNRRNWWFDKGGYMVYNNHHDDRFLEKDLYQISFIDSRIYKHLDILENHASGKESEHDKHITDSINATFENQF